MRDISLYLFLTSPLHVADPVFPFAGSLSQMPAFHLTCILLPRLTRFQLLLALVLSPRGPVYLHSLQTDTHTRDLESGYGRKCGICSFTAFIVLSAMKLANVKL